MYTLHLIHKNHPDISDDAWALRHFADLSYDDWQDVIDAYRHMRAEYAPRLPLLILDDADQCHYTSAHACDDERLYYDDDNIDDVPDDMLDVAITNAAINACRHYAAALGMISDDECLTHLSQLRQKSECYSQDDHHAIIRINQMPKPVMDKTLMVKLADADMLMGGRVRLAILPNGYFSADFSPFENQALIMQMAGFGYELMGLGAALLGFIKTSDFSDAYIDRALTLLQQLYHLDDEHRTMLGVHISTHDYLLLPYSESPSDYLHCY